jgi:hypothetical protein
MQGVSKKLSNVIPNVTEPELSIVQDIAEVGWGDGDWIGLAQDRDGWRALVNSVLNLRVP